MTTSHTRRHTTRITNTVNEDGELLDHQELGVDILVKGQEDFYFTFARHLGAILNLDGNEIKVLLWCSMNMQLNTNEIVLNKAIKQRLSEASALKVGSIENALTRLCAKDMMRRTDRGVYFINPETTWKGKINERAKSMKLYLTYTVGS